MIFKKLSILFLLLFFGVISSQNKKISSDIVSNSIIKQEINACNYKFGESSNDDEPYTASYFETKIGGLSFNTYIKNTFGEGGLLAFINCKNKTRIPKFFKYYRSKISEFDSQTVVIIVNGKYIKLNEKLDWPTFLPEQLIYFRTKDAQFLLFQLYNFSYDSSYFSPLYYTSILIKLDVDNNVMDNYITTSKIMEKRKLF